MHLPNSSLMSHKQIQRGHTDEYDYLRRGLNGRRAVLQKYCVIARKRGHLPSTTRCVGTRDDLAAILQSIKIPLNTSTFATLPQGVLTSIAVWSNRGVLPSLLLASGDRDLVTRTMAPTSDFWAKRLVAETGMGLLTRSPNADPSEYAAIDQTIARWTAKMQHDAIVPPVGRALISSSDQRQSPPAVTTWRVRGIVDYSSNAVVSIKGHGRYARTYRVIMLTEDGLLRYMWRRVRLARPTEVLNTADACSHLNDKANWSLARLDSDLHGPDEVIPPLRIMVVLRRTIALLDYDGNMWVASVNVSSTNVLMPLRRVTMPFKIRHMRLLYLIRSNRDTRAEHAQRAILAIGEDGLERVIMLSNTKSIGWGGTAFMDNAPVVLVYPMPLVATQRAYQRDREDWTTGPMPVIRPTSVVPYRESQNAIVLPDDIVMGSRLSRSYPGFPDRDIGGPGGSVLDRVLFWVPIRPAWTLGRLAHVEDEVSSISGHLPIVHYAVSPPPPSRHSGTALRGAQILTPRGSLAHVFVSLPTTPTHILQHAHHHTRCTHCTHNLGALAYVWNDLTPKVATYGIGLC